MGFAQTEQKDQNLVINQTDQTKMWVLNIPNRKKFGYWPDQTEQNTGFAQTEQAADTNTVTNQTERWVFTGPNY